ncbi:hypothetical protein [Pleionea sediminis]|uniref:hypothetical protein n=1 Tax=Pleionea sediminis TaxID=2569479 RepID=UPI00118628D9|nr:hypothetical protein [Pleionea sediminis]
MNDQYRSQELLETRKSGLTFPKMLKKSGVLIFIRLVLIGLCGSAVVSGGEHASFALLAGGVLLGALAQDLGWYLRLSSAWSFTEKVTDWEKVEELAKSPSD